MGSNLEHSLSGSRGYLRVNAPCLDEVRGQSLFVHQIYTTVRKKSAFGRCRDCFISSIIDAQDTEIVIPQKLPITATIISTEWLNRTRRLCLQRCAFAWFCIILFCIMLWYMKVISCITWGANEFEFPRVLCSPPTPAGAQPHRGWTDTVRFILNCILGWDRRNASESKCRLIF